MAAVRHLIFQIFAVFGTWPLSACRSASWCKISLKSHNRLMSYGQKSDFQDGGCRHLEFKKIKFFGHKTVIGFNICCSVPNFIKIGWFFTDIWRFNDFLNGGRPPSWILKFEFLVMWLLSAYSFASWYKMSLKSDNRSMSYGYKSDFQDGGGCHLEFKKNQFLVTRLSSSSISAVMCQISSKSDDF